MDMEAELVEARAVKSTMRKPLAGTERRMTAVKSQLNEAQFALRKLVKEPF